ncbi:MAG: hypothetical protein ABIP90_08030, partial [Vicinamibacterales bacterium]
MDHVMSHRVNSGATDGGPVYDASGPPRVDGKFLCIGGKRFLVKGATYGTFAPDLNGQQFPGR